MESPEKIERTLLVQKLIAGTATQEERDNALATIMLSLWTMSDLRNAFDTWHSSKCEECPLKNKVDEAIKKYHPDGEPSRNDWKAITFEILKYMGWALLIIAGLLKINLGS